MAKVDGNKRTSPEVDLRKAREYVKDLESRAEQKAKLQAELDKLPIVTNSVEILNKRDMLQAQINQINKMGPKDQKAIDAVETEKKNNLKMYEHSVFDLLNTSNTDNKSTSIFNNR